MEEYIIETLDLGNGIKGHIVYDTDPINMREDDDGRLGYIVSFANRYNFSDSDAPNLDQDDFSSWDDVEKYLIKYYKATVILPVYKYEHGGIWLSTNGSSYPFNDRWDSCQIGFIFSTEERRKKVGVKRSRKIITKYLIDEVQNYSDYVSGEVYGYIIEDESGDVLDSCFGYIGDSGLSQLREELKNYHPIVLKAS